MNANTSLVVGSLEAIAKRDNMSLAESFLTCDIVVLCDTSGSMSMKDSRGGKSRYDVSLEELAQLQATMPGKLGIISFSSNTMFCPGGQPFDLGGGTDLAGALRFAKVADVPGMQFIVISDGKPDSEQEALKEAKRYDAKISTIFVGPEDDLEGGRKFLQQLAAASGGASVTADRAKELASKVERLLLTN